MSNQPAQLSNLVCGFAKRIVAICGLLTLNSAAMAEENCAGANILSADWASDWSGKNLENVLALYSSDAIFLPSSHERWAGLTEIRQNFAALQEKFAPDIHLKSLVCEASGDLAYDSGQYEEVLLPIKGGSVMHFSGDYLFIFRREASVWKILEQIFTVYDPKKL
ncbi:YybH family protein [Nitrospirillum sp. BR 11163]|uniref:YybH family protein n=1 Tax=Nitrospirillum sp. BR 11163 TaxID=3104323 RepID=UPI002AFF5825|nr:DUF4440 domain-containing protein [Nitrospirillum sp. BR 11163]MEA1674785.1 DUF4440 domain-containing protein [Nitrospirillum sp. BR 11163]